MKKKRNWFQRRKAQQNEARLAQKHSTPEQQYTIEHRLPNVGDTPVPYEIPEGINTLLRDIEKLASDALSTLDLNELNEGYMDQYISTVCRVGITNDLQDQRFRHQRCCLSIREELRCQQGMLEKRLKSYREIYDANRKELETL